MGGGRVEGGRVGGTQVGRERSHYSGFPLIKELSLNGEAAMSTDKTNFLNESF